MNSAVLYIAISLDGFVAGPNDDISWLLRYNDVDYGFNEFFSGIGAIIQGRRAYEVEIKHGWETPIPVPTFVLSHHLPERNPQRSNVVFTDEDVSEVLKKAKQMTSKNVWIEGGANVAQQFLDRELIDVIVLSIVPVILGDGIRLFGKTHKMIEFTLREVRQFDKGLVQLTYIRE
ncbi:dihydrofolate reductase family protein [Desulfocurvibacter africanus]|uniref:dihydrofolate reductase family protein n=1 Tax=Desulfocurvibacter africanus TaxID=873 RepID=UPI002FD9FAF6